MRKYVASAVGVVAGAALVIQAMSSPVGASVSNPGSVTFMLDVVSIAIGSTTGAYDASTDSGPPAKLVGTINANGSISIPTSGATFPVFYVQNDAAGGDGVVTVTPRLASAATGTLAPDTGAMTLRLKLIVDLDATNLPSACAIGSTSAPIDMTALATTTAGGTAYSQSTGAATLVDRTYAVPGSSGCSFLGSAINNALGLPSTSGNNVATFALHSTSVLTPGPAPTSSTAGATTSTSNRSTTTTIARTTTTRPPFTWPWQTTTTRPGQTTTTLRATTSTTTVRPTTSTTGRPPVTTTTTQSWWCWWCA